VVHLDVKGIFKKNNEECPFCNPQKLAQQAFLSENGIIGFYPHKPIVPGHVLILPARHVARYEELTQDELEAIGALVRRIHEGAKELFHEEDYLLLQKNGREAGQSVLHLHFHYLPRSKNMGQLTFIVRLFFMPWMKPISPEEMKWRVDNWRRQMETDAIPKRSN
jgi:histidine triad (HIT) family protein